MNAERGDNDDMTAPARTGPEPVQTITANVNYTLANKFRETAGHRRGAQRAAIEEAMRDYIEKHTGQRPD